MTPKQKSKIFDILLSKNFTIIYTDNGICSLYKGRFDIEDVDDWNKKEEIIEFNDTDGYAPDIVSLLVELIGGNIQSF